VVLLVLALLAGASNQHDQEDNMAHDTDDNHEDRNRLPRRVFLGLGTAAVAGVILRSRYSVEPVEANVLTPKDIKIVQFSPSGQRQGIVTVQTIVKPDADWKQQLSAEAYTVTRHAGTERAYSGRYWDNHEKGIYQCICCGTANFSSETKFESGTGWPSFWQAIAKENVRETTDGSFGMLRTAVSCPRCDAHLGHVFDDGPHPTGLRYCMNSVSLDFVKAA
jgi:peptide-methionine (R)-S-oxide reductase